jgi:hypothetical protein
MDYRLSSSTPNIFLSEIFIKEFANKGKASPNGLEGRWDIVNAIFAKYIEQRDEENFTKEIQLHLSAPEDREVKDEIISIASKYFETKKIDSMKEKKTFSEAYRFMWKENEVRSQYQTLQENGQIEVRRQISDFREMSCPGGTVNVAYEIKQKDKDVKIGIMIAANSGLPGGALGKRPDAVTIKDVGVKTQEESIWADVVLTACGTDSNKQKIYYDKTIGGKWGLPTPTGSETMTKQGIDFTKVTEAADYNGVFVLNNCMLSALDEKKNLRGQDTYQATLIFADSINANPKGGSPGGTMQRTLNQKAINDYSFFCQCIKEKLRSSLDAMVKEGITYPLIARISCGVYAPDYFKRGEININHDFPRLLKEVVDEQVGPNGEKRGQYFQDIIIPKLG